MFLDVGGKAKACVSADKTSKKLVEDGTSRYLINKEGK
jgi:hypothetical protein